MIRKILVTVWRTTIEFLQSVLKLNIGIVWTILLVLVVLVVAASLLAVVLGVAIGIPALALFLAWNWVVPVFGGPSIGYWTAVGMVILLTVIFRIIHR